MKKIPTIIILLILVILCLVQFKVFKKSNQVCINRHCYQIEIADTDDKRREGLMYREQLDMKEGMFFIFPISARHSFWMKNTYIPLDMIWLDSNKRIVHIEENVQPCQEDPCPSYRSPVASLYVLELNAGLVQNHGIKVNDVAAITVDL